jgi:hypothetical protein
LTDAEFTDSLKGMLGKGVYFARSIDDMIGKANNSGACIIAEIRMDKVFEFDKKSVYSRENNPHYDSQLRDFVCSSEWHNDYDTCYMNHENDNQDEFCVKDPKVKQ